MTSTIEQTTVQSNDKPMGVDSAPAFDVLKALAPLAEPLAPAIARIRVALADAEPIEEGGPAVSDACAAIRAEGDVIQVEWGLEGLSFALVSITSEAGERAEAFEALIQRAWSSVPNWGSAVAHDHLPPAEQGGR